MFRLSKTECSDLKLVCPVLKARVCLRIIDTLVAAMFIAHQVPPQHAGATGGALSPNGEEAGGQADTLDPCEKALCEAECMEGRLTAEARQGVGLNIKPRMALRAETPWRRQLDLCSIN